MSEASDRREARRFVLALPLLVRSHGAGGIREQCGRTRDVSFRGLYFSVEGKFEAGEPIEFVLTLPKEITLNEDVRIRCAGRVVRVDPGAGHSGIAVRIERYEFLPESRARSAVA